MIAINYRDARPIYEQLRDGFRQLILSGVLRPDERLPSVRELAGSLAVNPNTIQRAYRELEAEGYICSVPGKGSFVCREPEALRTRRRELLEKLGALGGELRLLGVSEQEMLDALRGGDAT